jgi:crotonobetainyl-CoA:carnitine CoA-transferase CaiB-like acyl-CoA transferase
MATRNVLEGIRVVDWTQFTAGPAATQLLGSLGAEVIKLEMPERGDPGRGNFHVYGVDCRLPGNNCVTFVNHNRNKKSMTLNLSSTKGRQILGALVRKSDVFVTNFMGGRRRQFKVEYEDLKRYNPQLIYAVNTIFGSLGPDSGVPGWDLLGQAKSGIMLNVGESYERPLQGTPAMADMISAMTLCFGIITALLARERLGVGQQIEVSQLGSIIATAMSCPLSFYMQTGNNPEPFVRDRVRNPLTTCYRCKDGQWVMLCSIFDKHWPVLVEMCDNDPELASPGFATLEGREQNSLGIIAILDRIFATRDAREWEELARNAEFPLCTVNSTESLVNDPQVAANGFIIETDDPVLGKIRYPGYPFHMSETPFMYRERAPELGQHTEEVLIEICEYGWEDIARFREEGVI